MSIDEKNIQLLVTINNLDLIQFIIADNNLYTGPYESFVKEKTKIGFLFFLHTLGTFTHFAVQNILYYKVW